jgi:FkbM family methyltransferase
MNPFILRLAYMPAINKILRNILLPVGKFMGKQLISVSGKIRVKVEGIKFQLHTNQTCSVTQVLFYEGAENYEFTKIFTELIKKSNVFFDIGANIGYFSILAAKCNPNVNTFAFEPSKGALHYLKLNRTLNRIEKNVRIIDKAVSDINGSLEFHEVINPKYPWLEHNLNGSNSLQNIHGKEKNQTYAVQVTTLQQVVEDNKLDTIDLIKIDTECTEHFILQSSLDIISQYRPIIICEVYPVIRTEVQAILHHFKDYQLYEIYGNRLTQLNHFGESSANEYNYIFCPVEKKAALEKFI